MKIVNDSNFKGRKIGKKAYNLFLMRKKGINVPKLFCVNEVDGDIIRYIDNNFKDVTNFSIRSSSSLEDSEDLSFAGQFSTFLNIEKDNVVASVSKCLNSVNLEKLRVYAKDKSKIDMWVIIQEMIVPQKSGVIFTSNPQGILNESVIVVGEGTGNNIVEEKVPTTSYYYNLTDNIYYYDSQDNAVKLTIEEVKELVDISKKVQEIFGENLDIEFCISNNRIYILQARKITTLNYKKKIVLDNSNIVESYPGITLPLTQSFVKEAYYGVFKGVFCRLTNDNTSLKLYDIVLKNMVAVANGRLYYEIDNFYNILKLLPFSSLMISVWQEMIGVENKEILWDKNLKVKLAVKINIIKSFLKLLKTNNTEMEELNAFFKTIEKEHFKKIKEELSNKKLIKIYEELKNKIIEKWYITLVNDMYAFLYTSLLKRQLKKECGKDFEIVSNAVIANISNLESMKPIEKLVKISKYIRDNDLTFEIKKIKTHDEAIRYIKQSNSKVSELLNSYIDEYGDRNVEELKLESDTFRTNPELLLKKILEYISDDNLDKYLVKNTKKVDITLSKKAKKYLQKAQVGIKNREISRLSRSKLYGVMRSIVLNIGRNFVRENRIKDKKDIFYLYYDEIVDAIDDVNLDLNKLIENRKLEYAIYKKLPSYSRIVFADRIINKHPLSINNEYLVSKSDIISGTPASGGKVQGKVIIVNEDNVKYVDTKDKIIVTKMTDPGWVYLIVKAKGLISEKGSLLSHSAIISRELNKPSIVGVKNITNILKDGQIVELDANSGIIKIIE